MCSSEPPPETTHDETRERKRRKENEPKVQKREQATRVLILGRPNTGKSTLFNRLLQSKVSPTTSRAGMTQDWLEEKLPVNFHGHDAGLALSLIDSAGADPSDEGARAWHKTRLLIEEVALVLFVLDARTELTAIERDLATLLRGKKVVVVVNKGEGLTSIPEPCTQLGFETTLLISALHGQGIETLRETIGSHLGHDLARSSKKCVSPTKKATQETTEEEGTEEEATEEEGTEESSDATLEVAPLFSLALLGRPNSGKSTLANRLLGEERMIVEATAGTTRNAVRSLWQQGEGYATLVDTAGLRKQSSVRKSAQMIEQESARDALRALRQASVVALVVEATRPFDKQDRTLAARALKAGKPLMLLVNKWDMLSRVDRKIFSHTLESNLTRFFPDVQGLPVITVSALYDKDVSVVFSTAHALHRLTTQRIPTARINTWLAHAKAEHPPPQWRGRATALRYATQVDAAPPRILIRANAELPQVYLRYLTASLRRSFDWRGVPLVLEVQTPPQRNP